MRSPTVLRICERSPDKYEIRCLHMYTLADGRVTSSRLQLWLVDVLRALSYDSGECGVTEALATSSLRASPPCWLSIYLSIIPLYLTLSIYHVPLSILPSFRSFCISQGVLLPVGPLSHSRGVLFDFSKGVKKKFFF